MEYSGIFHNIHTCNMPPCLQAEILEIHVSQNIPKYSRIFRKNSERPNLSERGISTILTLILTFSLILIFGLQESPQTFDLS